MQLKKFYSGLILSILICIPIATANPAARQGPLLDELIWIMIREPGAAVEALLSGQVDMVDLSRPGDIETCKAAGFPIISRPYGRIVFFAPNHNRTITGDLAFRKAIAHLLPKTKLLATYVGPLGTYETNIVPAAFGEWYNPNVPDITEYDPELAAYLLDQAGYTINPATRKRIDPRTGTDMKPLDLCYYVDIPFRGINWAEPYARELENAGIPVNLVPVGFGTGEWYSKLVVNQDYDLWLGGYAWAPGSPAALDAIFTSWAWLPEGGYHNPTFDALIYEAMHTFNHTRAVEATWEAERIAIEDVAVIPCFSLVVNTAIHPDLIGFGVGPYIDISSAATLLPRWKGREGGTLRIAYTDEASNMIPGFDESARADIWWGYFLDSTIDYNPFTGAMMPWVAKEWRVEGWSDPAYGVTDGMIVYIKIKDNIYWHDGFKFTVDDIKFNFEYWRNKKAPRGADQVADLVKIDVLNPYEIKIYYSTVKPITFETYAYQFCRTPKHIYNDNVTLYGEPAGPMDLQFPGRYGVPDPSTFWPTDTINPYNSSLTCLVGIGPWILPPGGWEKGKSMRMVANRNYHFAPLLTDVNFDFKVDIKDIFILAKAFGTDPGHPRWNIAADINGDKKVDIKDIFLVAKDFGKTW